MRRGAAALRRVTEASGLLCTLSLFAACGGAAGGAEGVRTEVDTVAGTVMVHNTGAAPRLELAPLFAVGGRVVMGEASPEDFGRIRAVLLGPEGELYVADGQAATVTVFDSTGRHLRTIGRRGAGPGEIESLMDAAWVGDTLVVMDPENARLTRLTRTGEYLGTWPFMRASGTGVDLKNVGAGELYSFAVRMRADRGTGAMESAWARFSADGVQDTVPRTPPGQALTVEGSSEICRGDGISFYTNPLGEVAIVVPAAGGAQAVARTSAYRIAFAAPSGDTVRVLSRHAEPVPLADEDWAPVEENYTEWKEAWRGADCEGSISRPRHRRLVLGLHHDDGGRLVVEYEDPNGRAFDLYDHEGRWTARLPYEDRDMSVDPAFRDGRVALVRKDELDVQRVEVFRIAPGRRGS